MWQHSVQLTPYNSTQMQFQLAIGLLGRQDKPSVTLFYAVFTLHCSPVLQKKKNGARLLPRSPTCAHSDRIWLTAFAHLRSLNYPLPTHSYYQLH